MPTRSTLDKLQKETMLEYTLCLIIATIIQQLLIIHSFHLRHQIDVHLSPEIVKANGCPVAVRNPGMVSGVPKAIKKDSMTVVKYHYESKLEIFLMSEPQNIDASSFKECMETVYWLGVYQTGPLYVFDRNLLNSVEKYSYDCNCHIVVKICYNNQPRLKLLFNIFSVLKTIGNS